MFSCPYRSTGAGLEPVARPQPRLKTNHEVTPAYDTRTVAQPVWNGGPELYCPGAAPFRPAAAVKWSAAFPNLFTLLKPCLLCLATGLSGRSPEVAAAFLAFKPLPGRRTYKSMVSISVRAEPPFSRAASTSNTLSDQPAIRATPCSARTSTGVVPWPAKSKR